MKHELTVLSIYNNVPFLLYRYFAKKGCVNETTKEKRKGPKNSEPSSGSFSNQWYQELEKVYELMPFVKVVHRSMSHALNTTKKTIYKCAKIDKHPYRLRV